MANNTIQIKRTTVTGRTPNTTNSSNTQYLNLGELALNLTDFKMFTSNGTTYYEVGANLVNQNITNSANIATKLTVGSGGFAFGASALVQYDGSSNTYVQVVGQNANAGNNASTDYVVTADTGNDSINYVDLGINSSTYSNSQYSVVGALGGYLYSSNSDFAFGVASANNIFLHANGTTATNIILTINAAAITIANTIGLVVNGSLGSAGQVLTSPGATGNLYWSTVTGGSGSVNTANQYVFSNTITFNANIVANGFYSGNLSSSQVGLEGVSNNNNGVYGYSNTSAAVYGYSQQGTGGSFNSGGGGYGLVVTSSTGPGLIVTAGGSGSLFSLSNSSTTLINMSANGNVNAYSFSAGNSTSYGFLANTLSLTTNNIFLTGNVTVNGSIGTAGYVLTSGGASGNAYWAPSGGGSGSVNTANQYVFSNTITFSNNIVVGNSTVHATINSTSYYISNSTLNTTANATGFYVNNSPVLTLGITYATSIGFALN